MNSYIPLKLQNVHYAKLDFYEWERIHTFQAWPSTKLVMPLTKNGLKSEGISHRVRCVSCQKTTDISLVDNALVDAHFTGCAFENGGQDLRNITVSREVESSPEQCTTVSFHVPEPTDLDESDIRQKHVIDGFNGCVDACLSMCPCDTCLSDFHEDNVRVMNETSGLRNRDHVLKTRQLKMLYIQPGKAGNNQFSQFGSRVSTFPPGLSRLTRRSLAVAGFFFVCYYQDVERFIVECNCCGLRLWVYEPSLSHVCLLWVLHAELFPTCPYLRKMAGDNFIHRRLWIKRTNLNTQIDLRRRQYNDGLGGRLFRCW
ncbi:uncharacterized protein LOC117327390 [Pecten maximus]|uniref:uncharacterized protein LOC117327390 n=1 Tax=Pecten maximus TaxID=6579 RepID=UPI001458E690|nr:uncharacterized protein LOC117327390 [Pecten maximus]